MRKSKKQIVLEILQRAKAEGRNYGAEPERVDEARATGWVTGWHFVQCGAGTRYGARIHDLRQEGIRVEHHHEHRGHAYVPFYRLED